MIENTGLKLEDLLTDESFKAWVKGTADESVAQHWEQLAQSSLEIKELIQEAVPLIKSLSVPVNKKQSGSRQLVWSAIEAELNKKPMPVRRRPVLKIAVAAAVMALLAVGVWKINRHSAYSSGRQQQTTVMAERKQLVLPDESVVLLGANSSLSWQPGWRQGQAREVWLKGDASFDVKHLNRDTANVHAHERFLVHIDNNVTIEVLGTVFLVRNRRGKTIVSLESGAVKVDVTGAHLQQLLLKPGETVEVNKEHAGAFNMLTQSDSIATQWRSGIQQLNNTSVQDIVQIMEDNYGRSIKVGSPELLNKRVDGVLPLNNEKQALMALSSILDASIREEKDGTMVLRKN